MRIRNVSPLEKIELQMTPMIDVVFQLLVFFIMSFRIATLEGDFNIKMPAQAPSQGTPDDTSLPPMTLRLIADAEGKIAGVQLNDFGFGTSFDALHEHVLSIIGSDAGPGLAGDAEIEIDCDYRLHYEYVVQAITAVLGYRTEEGAIVKLIEKVRFAPPRK